MPKHHGSYLNNDVVQKEVTVGIYSADITRGWNKRYACAWWLVVLVH